MFGRYINWALIGESLRRMAAQRAVFGRFDWPLAGLATITLFFAYDWLANAPTGADLVGGAAYIIGFLWAIYTAVVSTSGMIADRIARDRDDGTMALSLLAARGGLGYLVWLAGPVLVAVSYRLLRVMALFTLPVAVEIITWFDLAAIAIMTGCLAVAVAAYCLARSVWATDRGVAPRKVFAMLTGGLMFLGFYAPFWAAAWDAPPAIAWAVDTLFAPGALRGNIAPVVAVLIAIAATSLFSAWVGVRRQMADAGPARARRRRPQSPPKGEDGDVTILALAATPGNARQTPMRSLLIVIGAGLAAHIAPVIAVVCAILFTFRYTLRFLLIARRDGVWDDIVLLDRSGDLTPAIESAALRLNWPGGAVIAAALILGMSPDTLAVANTLELPGGLVEAAGVGAAGLLGVIAVFACIYAARAVVRLAVLEALHCAVKNKSVYQMHQQGMMPWRCFVIILFVAVCTSPLIVSSAWAPGPVPKLWRALILIVLVSALLVWACKWASRRLRGRTTSGLAAYMGAAPPTADDVMMVEDPIYASVAIQQTAAKRQKLAAERGGGRMAW